MARYKNNQYKEYIIENFVHILILHICKIFCIIDNVINTISSGHGHFNTEGLFYNMDSKHFYMYK